MSESIQDGTGNSFLAKVDVTKRLYTRSVSEASKVEASINGDFWFLNCGLVALTSASASAVLHYKNENDFDLLMDRIVFGAGVSTGGTTNMCVVSSTIGSTGLSGGTGSEASAINANLGSVNPLDTSDSEIGQEAATITGGTPGPSFFYSDKQTSEYRTSVVIPKGSSLAISITPPAGNTSIAVTVALNVHKIVE